MTDFLPCPKRRFTSLDAAKRAHRRNGARIRVYACQLCHGYHVTNADKTPHEATYDLRPKRRARA